MLNKKRQELKNIVNKLNIAKEEGNMDAIKNCLEKAETLKVEIETLEKAEAFENSISNVIVNPAKPVAPVAPAKVENKTTEFLNIVKTAKTNPIQFQNVMSANGNEMIMPEDLVKEIRAKREADGSLENLISFERPTAKSGSRTLELDGNDEGLHDIDDNSDLEIGGVEAPTFKAIKFDKKSMAGLLNVANSLLEDSVSSLQSHIVKSLAKKGKKSLRSKILAVLDTFTKKTVKSMDDIKKIIEVDLDPAYLDGACVVMGQELYHTISSLKDTQGNYLMQPDVTQAGRKSLFGLPVVVITKKVITGNKMYIGNLKEAVYGFGDQDIKLAVSTEANFKKNQTVFRAIERFDIVKGFDDAVVVAEFVKDPVA